VYKIGILMFASLVLSACASYYSSTGDKQYLQSRNGPQLVVPPPLTRDNISQFYVLPEQTQRIQTISTTPP
jgi:uncharacterized lipoprotein